MLQEFFAFNGIAISCVTILIHDYFCTLPYEVEYVWKSPWSIGLPLFFVNRYLPFFDQTILTHFGMITFKSDALCERLFKAGLWMMVIGANFRSHIIFLQTCAIWGSPRLLVIFLGTLQAARVVVSVVLVHLQWSDALYPVVPELGGHCAVFTPYNYARWGYLTGCIVEAITITFTLIKAFQHLRNSNSSWVSQLYRNGIVYCIIIFLFSLVNIIIPEVPLPSPIYAGLMTRPQRLMESILCNRLMFIIFQYRKRASAYRVPRRLGLSRYYESKSGAAGHHREHHAGEDSDIFTDLSGSGQNVFTSVVMSTIPPANLTQYCGHHGCVVHHHHHHPEQECYHLTEEEENEKMAIAGRERTFTGSCNNGASVTMTTTTTTSPVVEGHDVEERGRCQCQRLGSHCSSRSRGNWLP